MLARKRCWSFLMSPGTFSFLLSHEALLFSRVAFAGLDTFCVHHSEYSKEEAIFKLWATLRAEVMLLWDQDPSPCLQWWRKTGMSSCIHRMENNPWELSALEKGIWPCKSWGCRWRALRPKCFQQHPRGCHLTLIFVLYPLLMEEKVNTRKLLLTTSKLTHFSRELKDTSGVPAFTSFCCFVFDI